jgi:hypothetical protein
MVWVNRHNFAEVGTTRKPFPKGIHYLAEIFILAIYPVAIVKYSWIAADIKIYLSAGIQNLFYHFNSAP